MTTRQQRQVDDVWFRRLLRGIDLNTRSLLHARSHESRDPFIVDLRGKEFIDLFGLLHLFLALDFLQARYGVVAVELPGIGNSETLPLPPDQFATLRRQGREARRLSALGDLYEESARTYRFLSFLANFGFFEALSRSREEGHLLIPGLSPTLLTALVDYRGAAEEGSCVVPLVPIRSDDDIAIFESRSAIDRWLLGLPADIASIPLFHDGEFAEVLGFQLAENIVEHAFRLDPFSSAPGYYDLIAPDELPDWGYMGAVAMRVLRCDKVRLLRDSFPREFTTALDRGQDLGLLEVVVGDRGIGILGSLEAKVQSVRSAVRLETTPQDCVAFALHPLGSRKPSAAHAGGAHALHRVVNCVAKYGGALRVRTGLREYLYTAETLDEQLRTLTRPLGIHTDLERDCLHPLGVQFQLLIPLRAPDRPRMSLPVAATPDQVSTSDRPIRVVAAGVHAAHEKELRSRPGPGAHLVGLANRLLEEPIETLIVFDFGSGDFTWRTVTFLGFLDSQEKVLHSHLCIGINFDPGLARLLREHELLDPATPLPATSEDAPSDFLDQVVEVPSHLFRSLAVNHRLFPVRDANGQIFWYGLGRNRFDSLLDRLVLEESSSNRRATPRRSSGVTLDELATWALDPDAATQASREEIVRRLQPYLRNNAQLFGGATHGGSRGRPQRWRSLLAPQHFHQAMARLVSTRLEPLMRDLGCFLDDTNYYRLPSSGEFSRGFVHSLPILQDEDAADQLSAWIGGALLELLPENIDQILLVGLTAPVELLAVRLSEHLCWPHLRVLNTGYFQHEDGRGLSSIEGWGIPAVLLTDIDNTGRTLRQLQAVAEQSQITVLGIVSLFRLVANEEKRAFYWRVPPGEDRTPHFVLADIDRPARISADSFLEKTVPEEQLYYVEPFSAHPFQYSKLSREHYRRFVEEFKDTMGRLRLLERADALRYGHWVYGEHHFRSTISFDCILASDILVGEIIGDLLTLCREKGIQLILLPLHSRISSFRPRLQSALRVLVGRQIPTFFCISTRNITDRPFYLLPRAAKRMIRRNAASAESDSGMRILIIDDAIASARTINTILRAIVVVARGTTDKGRAPNPVSHLYVYTILDRQGQAQRSVLRGMTNLSVDGDHQWRSTDGYVEDIRFSMTSWLDLEIPARRSWECADCRETVVLRNAQTMLGLGPGDPFLAEIERRMGEIRPHSTESKDFNEQHEHPLSNEIAILDLPARTVELALWYCESFRRQGYPYHKLLDIYAELRARLDAGNHNDLLLLTELGRLFFRGWRGLEAQWETSTWLRLFSPELTQGTALARSLLPEAGKALSEGRYHRGELQVHVERALIALLEAESSSDQADKADNLLYGLGMFAIYFRMFSCFQDGILREPQLLGESDQLRLILESVRAAVGERFDASFRVKEVVRLFRLVDLGPSFLNRLISVLEHTIRAKDLTHARILISEIRRLERGEIVLSSNWYVESQAREFYHALRYLELNHPALFKEKELVTLNYFSSLLGKLLEVWEREEGEQRPSPRLIYYATLVGSQFPIYRENRLFQALARVTISLTEVLRELEQEASEAGAQNEACLVVGTLPRPEVFILGPSKDRVKALLRNFTVKPLRETLGKLRRIYVELNPSEDRRARVRVARVDIWSTIAGDLSYGRGLVGIGAYDMSVFGIRGDNLHDARTGPDNYEYRGAVRLEFPLAHSPLRNEGERNGDD